MKNEHGFTIQNAGNGIHYIDGDIIPIQIIESKSLGDNLFLRNLRSNLSAKDMAKTLEAYKDYKPLDNKSVYLDRLIRANLDAFKEATKMSEEVRDIFLETAEENGWLNDRDTNREIEKAKKMAKKMLLDGESIEKVVRWTELPLETVISIASQTEEILAV